MQTATAVLDAPEENQDAPAAPLSPEQDATTPPVALADPLAADLRLRAKNQARAMIDRYKWQPDKSDPEQVQAYADAMSDIFAERAVADATEAIVGTLLDTSNAALAALPALEAACDAIVPAYHAAKLNPSAVDETGSAAFDEVHKRLRAIMRLFL